MQSTNQIRSPARSRLYTRSDVTGHGGWITSSESTYIWIQADLLNFFHVDAVATQGRDFVNHFQWVTAYTLAYGNTVDGLQPVVDSLGDVITFSGNFDQQTVVRNSFEPVRARFVRLICVAWTWT